MSETAVDPRMRARRIEVQREAGRKRLRRAGIAGAVVAVAVGAWGIAMTPLLDVDRVTVTGAAHTGDRAVQFATRIRRGDPMITVRLGASATRVAALPWVQTVEVTRTWPGTVRVKVAERSPAAAVPATNNGWVLLDAEGRELASAPSPPAGLLRLELPAIAPEPGKTIAADARAALALAATIPESLRGRIASLRPGPDGTVEGTVVLRNNAQANLLLGTPTQTAAKWLALLTVLDDADPAKLAQIDVRVPSAPALTRR